MAGRLNQLRVLLAAAPRSEAVAEGLYRVRFLAPLRMETVALEQKLVLMGFEWAHRRRYAQNEACWPQRGRSPCGQGLRSAWRIVYAEMAGDQWTERWFRAETAMCCSLSVCSASLLQRKSCKMYDQ